MDVQNILDMKQLLAWAGQAGAGIIAYYIIEHWWWANMLDARPKGIVAAAISGAIGALAWLAELWMGWNTLPTTPQEWAAALVGAALIAGVTAEGTHTLLVKGHYTRDRDGARVLKHAPFKPR